MITKEVLDKLQKGDKVTYIYISPITGLCCCLSGIMVGNTHCIEGLYRRFMLVNGETKGKFIEVGEGYLLMGWHEGILKSSMSIVTADTLMKFIQEQAQSYLI